MDSFCCSIWLWWVSSSWLELDVHVFCHFLDCFWGELSPLIRYKVFYFTVSKYGWSSRIKCMGLSFCMLILPCKLMQKSKKSQKFPDRVARYGYFKKWPQSKQTRTKIWHHFWWFLHCKDPKNVICLGWDLENWTEVSNADSTLFHIS